MKISRLYITCYHKDLYLLKICVASVRYWNTTIPIYLIKDDSIPFDTTEIEKHFNVELANFPRTNIGYYTKLLPFVNNSCERFFIFDSDVAWLGDLIPELEQFEEDVLLTPVPAEQVDSYMGRWFFNKEKLVDEFKDYTYPGFLFYAGQIISSPDKFSYSDFENIVKSKALPICKREDIFVGKDQGILNYVVGKKISQGTLSFRLIDYAILRWTPQIDEINFQHLLEKKGSRFLAHWHGPKNGLISFLPATKVLRFYEAFYYSKLKNGTAKLFAERLRRTVLHIDQFVYELLKSFYYLPARMFKRRK